MPGPTVAIETHGCKLNQADSGVLASELTQAGFRLVGEDESADVYLVNTCTVTHVADRKARQALRAARRRNPNATVVATGCYAQRSAGGAPGSRRGRPGRRKRREGRPGPAADAVEAAGYRPVYARYRPSEGQHPDRQNKGDGQDPGGVRPGLCLLHRAKGARKRAEHPTGGDRKPRRRASCPGLQGGGPHRHTAWFVWVRPPRRVTHPAPGAHSGGD